jgi:hypothetical protein
MYGGFHKPGVPERNLIEIKCPMKGEPNIAYIGY